MVRRQQADAGNPKELLWAPLTSDVESFADDLTLLEVASLASWSAFANPVWRGLRRPVSRGEVARALREGRLEPRPSGRSEGRLRHVERIAYLVAHPDPAPIGIDVGVPSLGYSPAWVVVDGNHRLAAALYRGDRLIRASLQGEHAALVRLGFIGPGQRDLSASGSEHVLFTSIPGPLRSESSSC